MFSWNDFLYAMFLTKADTKTISVALSFSLWDEGHFLGHAGRARPFFDAALVAMMILLNRYFVQGMTQGVH